MMNSKSNSSLHHSRSSSSSSHRVPVPPLIPISHPSLHIIDVFTSLESLPTSSSDRIQAISSNSIQSKLLTHPIHPKVQFILPSPPLQTYQTHHHHSASSRSRDDHSFEILDFPKIYPILNPKPMSFIKPDSQILIHQESDHLIIRFLNRFLNLLESLGEWLSKAYDHFLQSLMISFKVLKKMKPSQTNSQKDHQSKLMKDSSTQLRIGEVLIGLSVFYPQAGVEIPYQVHIVLKFNSLLFNCNSLSDEMISEP